MTSIPDEAGGKYYFDAEAADRPIRFIQNLLTHFQGSFAGQPFLLEPVQKQVLSDVYGWKEISTGLRRFNTVYWEGAIGCGKSLVLAGLGLYGLIGDNEAGAQVFSLAATFGQATIVFNAAKKFISSSPALSSRLQVRHAEIRHEPSASFWKIVPGTGPGAGTNCSTAVVDELHDFANGEGYKDLTDRMLKRRQPLTFCATNAGRSQASFCWQMRERAVAAAEGHGDPGLIRRDLDGR